jgi:hypothetical protein
MSSRHSLGSDMRRYRLTLSEVRDVSWRSIRYIRPQQKLKEVRIFKKLPFFKTINSIFKDITMVMYNRNNNLYITCCHCSFSS